MFYKDVQLEPNSNTFLLKILCEANASLKEIKIAIVAQFAVNAVIVN